MIKVSILYPNGDGIEFDAGYYRQQHLSLVQGKLGTALKGCSVDLGIGGGRPEAEPPFVAAGHLYFESVAAFQAAFGPHAKAIEADIANYTNARPMVQISEVLEAREFDHA
ncbi:MAG: EthD family reductase [Marinobacter sp.]|uniref:EthD family reductase n=1 Tax=Marinobacter sp. TaxID=50741 RepID=UPI00299D33B8|nr:EthD family reductase [Marinobacter sp.]MDX1757087.1 EthD family reductase [Marinobacter sp.]